MKYLTVATLFSGIGSAYVGLARCKTPGKHAAFTIIPAFCAEINKEVNELRTCLLKNNYNYNSPNLGDVTKITEADLKVYINKIDLLIFGSPCQDFSIAGKRKGGNKNSGTRSSLLWEAVRIINIVKPKYVIFENVKGILSFPHILKQYHDELDAYNHSQPMLLDPIKYNIPMKRPRVFIVSILKELNKKELVKKLPQTLLMKRQPLTNKLYNVLVHHRINLYNNYHLLPTRLYHNNGVFAYLKNTKNSYDRVWNINQQVGTFSVCSDIKIHDDQYWTILTNHDKLRLMGFCYKQNNNQWNDVIWEKLYKACNNGKKELIAERHLTKAIGNAMSIDILKMLFSIILI